MAYTKTGGGKPKDSAITQTVNTDKNDNISRSEQRRINMEKKRIEEENKKKREKLLKAKQKYQEALEELGETDGEIAVDLDESQFSRQMISDMREVFKSAGGKKMLLDLVKDDPKQFRDLIKELMRVETALMVRELNKKEAASGNVDSPAVFVILKGLETPEQVVNKYNDPDVDLAQIENALNPSAEKSVEVEEVKDTLGAPEGW
jgi:hypothetical protein